MRNIAAALAAILVLMTAAVRLQRIRDDRYPPPETTEETLYLTSGGALQRLLLMFASALITQMVQTAACNRHHPVHQQLCRWMLLSLDRLPSNQIRMNEKLIGNMLGLTPENVTKATSVLQKAGLIRYDAGEITVLDRRAVEKRSCECYAVVKRESDRLLPRSVEMAQ